MTWEFHKIHDDMQEKTLTYSTQDENQTILVGGTVSIKIDKIYFADKKNKLNIFGDSNDWTLIDAEEEERKENANLK